MRAATKLASLPFGELERLVKAIGECKSKSEEDRIISAEVDLLKQRLSDPRLDKTRGREYMVRVMYCEMLGHDASFAYIPALQMASDPNLITKKAAYLCLTQLLDYNNELVLLLVNTLLSDLKSDNFVVVATALVVTSKLIGADLINAVLPLVTERLNHPRESVRKKAVMALHHFHQMDPTRTGPLAGVDLERHFRTTLCDKEPSVMAATLNALTTLAAENAAPFRSLIPSLVSILKQVVEHRLPKAYDYHRFPAPFIQIKLLKLLRLLGSGDKAASDNMAAVVSSTLRRAAAAGNHTIGHAIVYEAVRTITEMYPNPALLASAAEAVAGLIKANAHNLKYCGLTALAAITRVSPKYAQEHQMAVIDCLEDPDETLKLKTLELLVTMTKANNVQVVVERLMAFLRSSSCGGDELLRRHIAGQIVDLAEKYALDTTWFIKIMAEVFEVGGDVLQPQLAHNLCRLIAEQDSDLHTTAVKMFLAVLDRGSASSSAGGSGGNSPSSAKLPDILLCCICWVLGEYGSLAENLPPPNKVTVGQVMDKLCSAVASSQASPTVRAHLLTALSKLAARQRVEKPQLTAAAADAAAVVAALLRPDAQEQLHKACNSSNAELQQRARETEVLLSLPPQVLSTVLPFDGSCEEFEPAELEEAKGLTFLDGYIDQALAAGAKPYNPPPEMCSFLEDEDLEALGIPGGSSHSQAATSAAATSHHKQPHKLRFSAYETAQAPSTTTAASAAGAAFGSGALPQQQQQPMLQQPSVPAAAAAYPAPAAAGAAAASYGQPQLALKGAGKGRWGPAEFGSSRTEVPAATTTQPAVQAPPAPAAAVASSSRHGSSSSQRLMSDRDRKLAASLFGSGEEAAPAAAAGMRGRQPAAKTPVQAPAPIADLLGGDLAEPPAAASPVNPPASGINLLLDPEPVAAATPAAVAAAPQTAAAAVAASPLDMLADLTGPVPAAAAGNNDPLLDLGSILGSPQAPAALVPAAAAGPASPSAGLSSMSLFDVPSTTQQQVHVQGMRPGMPVAGAGLGGAPMALKGGQPAKGATSLVDDPFKDLLG